MATLSAALTALLLATPLAAQDSPRALQDAFSRGLPRRRRRRAGRALRRGRDELRGRPDGGRGPRGDQAAWAPFFEANTIDEAELKEGGLETLGDAPVGRGLWRIAFTAKEGGEQVVMEGRYMDMSRKTDEGWRYVVDHASVPLPPAE